MSEPFMLGDLVVDLQSGDIRHPDGKVERLAPQPASLLALLVEHAGEVVDQERIREHLWADVAVDFESGLHYCVRQVRAALGDSASEARFIETLARRGYRLKVLPEPVTEARQAETEMLPLIAARGWVALFAVLLLAVFGLALHRVKSSVPRLAILPFVPPAAWQGDTRTEAIPELLLLALGEQPEHLIVLGPTQTSGYGADGTDLQALVTSLDVQWVVNGRYIEAGGRLPGDGRGVLVELIRAGDGAHVWVEAYPLDADPADVVRAVSGAVSSTVGAR